MAQRVVYDDRGLKQWIKPTELEGYEGAAAAAEKQLQQATGQGNDFLGWLKLPENTSNQDISAIEQAAQSVREKADVFICIGIGGSYLGAKSAIEFLSPSFEDMRKPRVIFLGHHVNSDYLSELLTFIDDKEVAVNCISKSGTTTEPGIAFRVIREWMEKRYGKKEAAKRIIATTDPQKGALRQLATEQGYTTFPIPGDVGGRFSVLTAVGLLPIAVAGIDIRELLGGACEAMGYCSSEKLAQNMAARYAANRNILFRRGKVIEMLAGFQPQLHFISEWWKQLSGESEGKNQTGIFPAAVDYTTDLHSLGQWMQEGLRNVFETFMILKSTKSTVTVPGGESDLDGLNYLAGKSFEQINENAHKATFLAHIDGGVPAANIYLEDRSAATLGQLFYFFEKAIGLSGYMLRVNPFDQPGVEAYKKNMFALLQKPGFEKQGKTLAEKIKDLES
ncbi:MAG: glucose-6-phosphate isomerase [Chitinivibrionales bacterium]